MTSTVTEPRITSPTAAAALCGQPRRKTKLVCTLGPASCEPEQIRQLIQAGANVFRLNFSHADHSWHCRVLADIRRVADELGACVAVMQDLCGPKIRLSQVLQEDYHVGEGDLIRITTDHHLVHLDSESGLHFDIASTYAPLVDDVEIGDTILLDDGRIELQVADKQHGLLLAEVRRGGPIQSGKGLNLPGVALSTESMTAKDWDDLEWGIAHQVDFVALSFVRHPDDLVGVRRRLDASESTAKLIAKIERPEAIEHLDKILSLADSLMVARGDLGLETDLAQVPLLQKHVIDRCRQAAKPVITATQMLESMVHHSTPTRAEVSDVANAVLDGTDAVMTSAETASGKYPVETVEAMSAICLEAERSESVQLDADFLNLRFTRVDQSIAYGALFTAHHLRVKAIAALTESGSTALWMSRHNIDIPIFAITPNVATRRKASLFRNVHTLELAQAPDTEAMLKGAQDLLLAQGVVQKGDLIVVTWGEPIGQVGGTNALKILRVGEY